MPKIPNPGSNTALKLGCKCPVMDNEYGKGYYGGPGFVINELCLLHNVSTKEELFKFQGYTSLTQGQKTKIVIALLKRGFLPIEKIVLSEFLFDDILTKDWVTPETLKTVTAYVLKVSPEELK